MAMVRCYVKKRLSLERLTVPQRAMYDLANTALQTVIKRTASAIDSADSPAPPLKSHKRVRWSKSQNKWVEYGSANAGWARIKQKYGLKPIRDLRGTGLAMSGRPKPGARRKHKMRLKNIGHLMEQITVRSVSENFARIEPSTRMGRIKANKNRAMLLFSPKNCVDIAKAAGKVIVNLAKRMVKSK
jgi:hypothetical protein